MCIWAVVPGGLATLHGVPGSDDHVHTEGMQLDTTTTTAASESPAKTEPTAEKSARSLMPVHVPEESLRGLPLFETYLTSELVITPTDSSWREILVGDKERFLKDAAK